jgi:hypothetical protein
MTAPVSILLAFLGLFMSARIRVSAIIFGQPVSVPVLDLIAAIVVLMLAVMVLFLLRSLVRDGLQLRPRRAAI